MGSAMGVTAMNVGDRVWWVAGEHKGTVVALRSKNNSRTSLAVVTLDSPETKHVKTNGKITTTTANLMSLNEYVLRFGNR